MQKIKSLGRVFSILLTALLALLLVFNLATIILRQVRGNRHATVFGITTAVVISGSMEPNISVNDMVVVAKQKDYKAKEVITYVSEGGSLVTHRIVEITKEGFITKGDFNNDIDTEAPIAKENVVGKVILVIPGIGAVQEFIMTPLGMLCITLLGFLLIWLSFRDSSPKDRKQEASTNEKQSLQK